MTVTISAFGNGTKASLRVRRRGCYIGAERRERGAGGRNHQRKENIFIASDERQANCTPIARAVVNDGTRPAGVMLS